ncbi:MAG: hypothetical protein QOJ15_10771, partial [Bradyrhizobium sp.]|nr:hypothetical protein [Bradyrhizobium sp.]
SDRESRNDAGKTHSEVVGRGRDHMRRRK